MSNQGSQHTAWRLSEKIRCRLVRNRSADFPIHRTRSFVRLVATHYYLFIPTWIFTIILYTLLAGKYGAAEKYPEEEEAERKKNAAIEEYQAQQALSEGEPVEDHSVFSKVLRVISLASLVITLVLAARVMFWSPDAGVYEENRETFYRYGFVCTIVYFVFAYWVLRRRLALNK